MVNKNSHMHSEGLQQPSSGERRLRLLDVDVETMLAEIVVATETGVVDPATALQQLEHAHNRVSIPSRHTPSPLSTARRLAVMAQARAHVTALTVGTPAYGMMRYDTLAELEIARQRCRLSGGSNFTGQIPTAVYDDDIRCQVLLNDIDHAVLERELAELSDVIRRNDWPTLLGQPLSVEPSYKKQPVVSKHRLHQEAAAHFALAWSVDTSPSDHHEHLLAVFQNATEALRTYNADSTKNQVALADCRLLYAKTLHDLAHANEFGDTLKGNDIARDVAIELLWEAADGLHGHVDPAVDTLLAPLKDWEHYSKTELQNLRGLMVDFEQYVAARHVLREIEYLRGHYTEEMHRDPNEHHALDLTSATREIGRPALRLVVTSVSALLPVPPASDMVPQAA